MMKAKLLTTKSDLIGATASALCFLHCLATPFIFVAHVNLTTREGLHPWWWGALDIFFLVISFYAVYWSGKNSSKAWIKYIFWALWTMLTFIIVNEKLHAVSLIEELIYFPTLGLIFLHFYNRKYCQCKDENCCIEGEHI